MGCEVVYLGHDPRPIPTIGVHYHDCPTCYERWACVEACSREPDLEEPDHAMQMGSHCQCDRCERAGVKEG